MEHRTEQKSLFPTEETSTKPVIEKPAVPKPAGRPEIEEIRQALLEEEICYRCGKHLPAENTILFGGKPYHKTCLPFKGSSDLQTNPRIEVTANLRASELALLLELSEAEPTLKAVHDRFADILCEHDNSYIRCSECGKVVLRSKSLIGGSETTRVKNETGVVISIASGRFFSRIRGVEAFCSNACDLNFSKKVFAAWEVEQKEKEEKKKQAAASREKKEDGFTRLMRLSKANPELAAKLDEILSMLKTPQTTQPTTE